MIMTAAADPPRCTFVTGPPSPARSRWLAARVCETARLPGVRCAVLLADERPIGAGRFAEPDTAVEVRLVGMPCPCCARAADLPGVAQAFARETGASRLFIEVPAVAAHGLIAEFDAVLGWPRDVVVCLSSGWSRGREEQTLSMFQIQLLALATRIVEPAACTSGLPGPAVAARSLA